MERQDKKYQKKVWAREKSGQNKVYMHGSNLASEAGGAPLTSPGKKKKVVVLKIHRPSLCFSGQHQEKAWGRSDVLQ